MFGGITKHFTEQGEGGLSKPTVPGNSKAMSADMAKRRVVFLHLARVRKEIYSAFTLSGVNTP